MEGGFFLVDEQRAEVDRREQLRLGHTPGREGDGAAQRRNAMSGQLMVDGLRNSVARGTTPTSPFLTLAG